jgi:hypothetical protein
MVGEPVSIVYRLTLTDEESKIFNRKLPSQSGIELFGTAITEGDSDMEIIISNDKVTIMVNLYFRDNMNFKDIRVEVKRIISEIEIFLNEPE